MYRKLNESKLKKYWYELKGSVLYCFRSKSDTTYKQMLLLVGNVNLVENKSSCVTEDDRGVYSFKLVFGDREREFFFVQKGEMQEWMAKLKQALRKPSFEAKYEMKEFLGKGKFGDVHRAEPRDGSEPVAVKIIQKAKLNKRELHSMISEIATLRFCRHPGIISLREVMEDEAHYYLIQEYVPGSTLKEYLKVRRSTQLSEELIKAVFGQMLSAVVYLHEHGIVHRDLKPDNIMIVEKDIKPKDCKTVPTLKLVDFGLATIIGPG